MLGSLIALGLAASVSATPEPLQAPPMPVGTLTLTLTRSDADHRTQSCPAVLITSDTILTQAACFDLVRGPNNGAGPVYLSYEARVELPGEDPVGLRAVALADGYTAIRCSDVAFAEPCAEAAQYCAQLPVGMARNVCRSNVEFYARTYRRIPSHNYALAYLSRALKAAPAMMARRDDASLRRTDALHVLAADGNVLAAELLTLDTYDITVPASPELRTAAVAFTRTSLGEAQLVGLPSHFATLPYDLDLPADYAISRIDTAADWIDTQLQHAFRDGRRLREDLPQRAAAPAPIPLPEPMPTPQPIPAPAPEPAPKPKLPPATPAPPSPPPHTWPTPPSPELPPPSAEPTSPEPSAKPTVPCRPKCGTAPPLPELAVPAGDKEALPATKSGCRSGLDPAMALCIVPLLGRRLRRVRWHRI